MIPLFSGFFLITNELLFVFTLTCATSIQMSFVANITHDSIDLVVIKFNISLVQRCLYIIEERHETVVHVQLLVAVEKRQSWIIGNKVYLGFVVSAQHHNIF